MSKLAVRLAVSAAAASVVMTGIEALRTGHSRAVTKVEAAPRSEDEAVSSAPRLARAVLPSVEPPPEKAPATPNPRAMASIHGRVLGQNIADLAVTIGDAQGQSEAGVDDAGSFQIKLPPGSYRVMATAGAEVAEAQVDDLAEDEDREVVLTLAPGVTIEGRMDGCDGACADVSISARGVGTEIESSSAASKPTGAFVLERLLPGHPYDVVFEGRDVRRRVVRGLMAPQRDLVVTLQSPPTLLGGFGIERGQECPMTSVVLSQKGEADLFGGFDRHCNFRFENLADVDSVHVRATGTGWRFEVDVPIPDRGEPAFLCLRAPCRQPDPEPEASLQVVFSGNPAGRATLRAISSVGGGSTSCRPSAGPCTLSGLIPAPGVKVTVDLDRCEPQNATVDLQPGTNTLPFHCQPLRRIQGLLRSQSDPTAALHARVRCSSERVVQMVDDFFFALDCPERQATIQYQLSSKHPWQAIAVPPGGPDSIAFMDIAVD